LENNYTNQIIQVIYNFANTALFSIITMILMYGILSYDHYLLEYTLTWNL